LGGDGAWTMRDKINMKNPIKKMMSVEYWACPNELHKHISEIAAQNCMNRAIHRANRVDYTQRNREIFLQLLQGFSCTKIAREQRLSTTWVAQLARNKVKDFWYFLRRNHKDAEVTQVMYREDINWVLLSTWKSLSFWKQEETQLLLSKMWEEEDAKRLSMIEETKGWGSNE